MNNNFSTPMMKQYSSIKKNYKDCLVLFRAGDFYELFLEDAKIGANILGITLTKRPEGKDGLIPMAGVPYHAVDSYLAKLVKAGFKVAICEQLSPPNKKGIIKRDVIRVITPGTLVDEKVLDKKENNFLISLSVKDDIFALGIVDLSTGNLQVLQSYYRNLEQELMDELVKLHPSECILSPENYTDLNLLRLLKKERGMSIYPFEDWDTFTSNAEEFLKDHFQVRNLSGFGIADLPYAKESAAALIGYLKITQMNKIGHIKKISLATSSDHVILDKSTLLNLEVFSTILDRGSQGTLLSAIDQTQTAMGGRMIKSWLSRPLTSVELINKRLDAVEYFLKEDDLSYELDNILAKISDIERILSRLSIGIGNARDLILLKDNLVSVLEIRDLLKNCKNEIICDLLKLFNKSLRDVISLIEEKIVDEPPVSLREGGFIKSGVSPQLDRLRRIIGGGKNWITQLEVDEKERTGISTLKVRFNKVFGFYIEVSKGSANLVPKNYIRKQTLVNGERFITSELKKQEEIILTSESKINELEYKLFQNILTKVLISTEYIQNASFAVGVIDCLNNFSKIARLNYYIRPKIVYSGEIRIKNGRHPVVEQMLEGGGFVGNDVLLSKTSNQLLLITGPNMAGKSVFIRQVALIVILSQVGSFVPADKAYITPVDKIFVRSGAADAINSGMSTFMVEMSETANILNHATSDSLIVMDEIGRGTSTYDGISIAWAIAEHLVTNSQFSPKTLFATHYHELQKLEQKYPNRIKNYHLEVENINNEPIFLHTVLPGAAPFSFGLAVAKLAGVPHSVIEDALKILEELEKRGVAQAISPSFKELDRNKKISGVLEFIQSIDLENTTPLQALNLIYEIKKKVRV